MRMKTKHLLKEPRNLFKKKIKKVDFAKLGPISFGKKPENENTIVSFGTRGGETEIFKKDGTGLLKSFKDKKKQALGPSTEELIVKDNKELREEGIRLKEAEKN